MDRQAPLRPLYLPGAQVVAADIAQRTTRIRIGTASALLPHHNPIRFAKDYAQVDLLSGERLDFGISRGFLKTTSAGFNQAMGESRERFQEGVEIMTRAGTQETFSYAGKFHTFRTVMVLPRPVQPPMPPFPAAVAVPPAIQHAGYHSFVDETPERARRAWEPHDMRYLRFVASLLAPSVELDSSQCASWQGRAEDLRRITFADIYPDQALCIDRIARREELGITHFYVCMDLGGLDQRALRGSMEQFAARVMPLFRRPGSGRDPVFGPHPG